MTSAEKAARDAALAAIHVGKKHLGLDDDLYREMIRVVTRSRIESCGDATQAELAAILDYLRKRGFTRTAPARAGNVRPLRSAQVRMARGEWIEAAKEGAVRNRSERAFIAFIKRLTGVDRPEWLTPAQANKVIEGIKAMRARAARRGGVERGGSQG